MKKVNFKQAKYVLPLIALPFILLFYYIGGSMFSSHKDGNASNSDTARVANGQINPNMPGVSKEIDGQQLKDKFEAYSDKFKNDKDYSAISGIQDSSIVTKLGSNYTEADLLKLKNQQRLDSLRNIFRQGQVELNRSMEQFGSGKARLKDKATGASVENSEPMLQRFEEGAERVDQRARRNSNQQDSYNDEMKAFREQMAYVDSMSKASGDGDAVKVKTPSSQRVIDPTKDADFVPVHVSSKPISPGGAFNTLHNIHNDPDNIRAVIDQEGKVQVGTRIRIKLLQDMYVAEKMLPAGSYLYGMIIGFQVSRINIGITQVMVGGTPVPVKLDIYDSDGYLGLYVPGSNFREFSKEIGTVGTNGLSTITTSDNTDVTTGIATKLFQTTTTSAAKLLAKDKAWIKYNYSVFLKERKNNSSNAQK